MDIWQSASPDDKMRSGWIGRHFDINAASAKLDPVAAIGLSTEKPRALTAKTASIPCFASLADIQNMVGDADMEIVFNTSNTFFGKDNITNWYNRNIKLNIKYFRNWAIFK